MRQLVEQMYEQNDNTRVTLIVHSYGGLVSHYFLTSHVTQEWKDTYINSYITLGAGWSGGNSVLPLLITGPLSNTSLEVTLRIPNPRTLSRTFSALHFLLPRPSVWADTILVITPSQNYSANNYQQLYADIGYQQGFTQFSSILRNVGTDEEFPSPNVSTYCFYGLELPTAESFTYGNGFPDNGEPIMPTSVTNGDGDGIVNKQSLQVCLRWANNNGGYTFNRTVFEGCGHFMIYSDEVVLQTIKGIVERSGALPLSVMKLQYVVILLAVVLAWF